MGALLINRVNHMKKDKYYRTSDIDLASFLFVKFRNVPEPQWVDGERKEFPFEKNPYLEELVEVFLFGDSRDERLLVSSRELLIARKQLLAKIKRG